jgi:hypothetical protein
MNTPKRKSAYKVPEDMKAGLVSETKNYGYLKILKYNNKSNVQVKFIGYVDVITTHAGSIRSGNVKNPMMLNVQDTGYYGIGIYAQKSHKVAYQTWVDMIKRCYNPYTLNTNNPTYRDCFVCKEWHNFQVFAKWFYTSNYQNGWQLDKDIINQNNKVYSPEACAFVDRETNTATIIAGSIRGKYMLGVTWSRKNKNFVARCKNGSNTKIHLGCFSTEIEAYRAYCVFKYKLLCELVFRQTDERVKQGLLKWVIPEY